MGSTYGLTSEFLYTTMMNQHRESMNMHRETSRAIASLRNLIFNPPHSNTRVVDEEMEEEDDSEEEEDDDVDMPDEDL
ncbi:unnamed protein product [Lathyrus sativus]|nr:unnamed protein product [Lathyrus sativus]